jgi:hypothetical protein
MCSFQKLLHYFLVALDEESSDDQMKRLSIRQAHVSITIFEQLGHVRSANDPFANCFVKAIPINSSVIARIYLRGISQEFYY